MEVPAIFLDAGNLFSDDSFSADQLTAEVMTKNKWVVKGYNEFRQTAANINYNDLPYVSTLLKKEGYEQRVKEFPFIGRLISANVHPTDDEHLAPPPYVIREMTLKRGATGKTIKIGIVGFTEPKPGGGDLYAGYRIENPSDAAKRVLPELKQKADLIVALVYMPLVSAQQIATDNGEIDTIIGARKTSTLDEPQHFNNSTITYAFDQTKYLGEMRYYVDQDGSIQKQKNRYVMLDDAIPDDRDARAIVNDAHTEFTNAQASSSQVAPTPTPTPVSTQVNNSHYIGVQACSSCHREQYEKWTQTLHSHAMATLESRNQQFDANCVRCHSVGFGKGGFDSIRSTPALANVQCESCHGPGSAHADNPQKGYGVMATPVGCTQCHTKENSPEFDFAAYWPKVQH